MLLGQYLRRGIEPMSDIVAIQHVAVNLALVQQFANQVGDRAFSAPAQASKPYDAATMSI